MVQILEFEREIFALETQIHDLVSMSHMYDSVGDITHEIAKLKKKLRRMKHDVYSNLKGWDKTLVARHPDRPYTLDYLDLVFKEFFELHGDRHGGYGPSIVGGVARFDGRSVMVVGHQKGRETKEKIRRNFGMSQPAGYRKALRLMRMAEKFNMPIITFIDTPGAYPGVDAEEKGQAEAIATNMFNIIQLKVPIICVVIGEGGSGGALAIGIGDHITMFEHSVYSVISPEGCASILWGDKGKTSQAADALCITANDLLKFNVIDEIIREPLGGAHRNHKQAAIRLRKSLRKNLDRLMQIPSDQLTQQRENKFREMGKVVEEGS
ncbi:MAG: acetyl-CoA carboxylase carboxyltransferase subunit alpha [Nitrospina sp.]|jgi:acetyl-CoA carboxylase carboxyl transferase subunit alpha|nr:acetyl-CoA carboxylase carboxyltransferase subunit alpha [Nitrospina sp.]MBT3511228.1 acetyl-CoA carboxylase carboxyltransferase subunit alpha [Nitrospina sp.]MBT3876424.1 acetyl-CoA carboxylase carboxyltransferase subunit alpha [Nitrospina sp.]MBT4047548.1 acetyl-CoA carboxylase carboxyltransferase subunit alpha [Nitrospina sp.]MBT4558095.1 acetyl-CoA carboxylase carboxyltransferase subunit alpha [Nitrospina sp.]